MRIAVADDEELFLKRIGNFLKQYLDTKNIGHELHFFNSGKQIVELGSDIRFYDVFFLDVSMKDLDGIETAKTIREYSKEAFIVFVTAYLDYSIEGYKVNAIRYVLKGNDNFKESLVECMETILKKMVGRKPMKRFQFNEVSSGGLLAPASARLFGLECGSEYSSVQSSRLLSVKNGEPKGSQTHMDVSGSL